ncbi:hypothetical protein O3G_MSEX007448 [Manduca sexta]|uniref:Endonuclease/exonuclease/phosphatase domain-containing protein n=1 Tax=Manduca sexta TaxID=7130 RepID=A0A921Z6W6_MANSE|nr:hypothetical protein O3G_MSEX007448 [Manduca sexta]
MLSYFLKMANLNKKRLRLGLLNARSLNTGEDELVISVQKHKPDILAINETWLKIGEDLLAPAIPNYNFIHKPRQGKRGGGVGFYIRQGIEARVRRHPLSSLEQLWLEVQLPGTTLALGTAYRPESIDVLDALDALSNSIHSMARCNYTCVTGDFNIDLSRMESPQAKDLMSFCYQHNLEQLVREPTRVTDHSETLLDIVMVDSTLKNQRVEVVHNRCLSDHAMVLVDFDVKKPKLAQQVVIKRCLHNIDLDNFNQDLISMPWSNITALESVEQMVDTFNKYILTLFDIHAPIKKLTVRHKPKPWITDMVKFMIDLRDEALIKAQVNKTESSKDYYRSFRNLVTATIEREIKAYFNTFINSNLKYPALLWKSLKNTTILDKPCTHLIPDHLNNPDAINDHFLNLPLNNSINMEEIPICKNKNLTYDIFDLKPTTESEVKKIIYSIQTKAAGYDSINIDMIKATLKVTLPVITNIVNKSIETHTFPSYWKRALVRPLPKKNTASQLNDLRPISILPVLSKVIEKVALDQILKFLDSKSIIPKFQSGFRRGHGTETALLHVTDDLTEASYINENLRILLTESLVLSQFNYCSTVFGPRLNSKTERIIQRVQNSLYTILL